MASTSKSSEPFDPLESWEAPWNHMKYFWHNDSEPSNEERISSLSSSQNILPDETQVYYQVFETTCTDKKRTCPRKEIVAIKPIPWRNVSPPRSALPPRTTSRSCICEEKKVSRRNSAVRGNVLKFRKSPQKLRYCTECITRWKEEAANDAVAEMFQSIREASTEKKPGQKCKDELVLPSDICSFCNQPLSPFGFCNECLPPTPIGKLNADKDQPKISETRCTGECVDSDLPSAHFMNPCKLLHEINKLQPTFVLPHNSSPQDKNIADEFPTPAIHDQFERDCQVQKLIQSPQIRKCCVFETPMLSSNVLQQRDKLIENPFTFNHHKDCPLQGTTDPENNSNKIQIFLPEQNLEMPLGGFQPGSGFLRSSPMETLTSASGVPGVSRGCFAATLDVGNASAQDITVVLYANRVLVAEALNHTLRGENVSAQTWALPPEVDVATLRCYLADGKLNIVAFPLPPGFTWKFAANTAALGPPKFCNFPCPFQF